MGTPNFVKFSQLKGTPAKAYERLNKLLFIPMKIKPVEVVVLRKTEDPFYGGLIQDGKSILCDKVEELIQFSVNNTSFGSVHIVPYVPAYFYFHFFNIEPDSFSFVLSFDPSLLSWENDHFEMGMWVKKVLILITEGLDADVCGYDPCYDLMYESLDPKKILNRLKSGDLLEISFPTFHAVTSDLISYDEMANLIKSRKIDMSTQDLEYEITDSGYHILSILP